MSCPTTPTTTTSAATTTPNATPNEPYDASPATPTDSATPSASTPSKPHGITQPCFSHRYFRRRAVNPRPAPTAPTGSPTATQPGRGSSQLLEQGFSEDTCYHEADDRRHR